MENALSQAAITAITALIVGIPSFLFGRRGRNAISSKTEADAIKVLSEVVANLGSQLSVAHAEMPIWKAKINDVEAEAKLLVHRAGEWEQLAKSALLDVDNLKSLLNACESREPLGIEAANKLRAEAASILENISHLSFVPIGEPTKEDTSAVRRLKEIREAALRMTTNELQ